MICAAAQAQNISIATGGTGGVYYPLGGALAAVLSKYVPGMQATAEVTGGSVANTYHWKRAIGPPSQRGLNVHGHTGELLAHGWVTKPGRRVAFAEGDVRDPAGKLLATASSTCLIMAA